MNPHIILSTLAGRHEAKLAAWGYRRRLRRRENIVAQLKEPSPFLSRKNDRGDQENRLKGVKVSAEGQLCSDFKGLNAVQWDSTPSCVPAKADSP